MARTLSEWGGDVLDDKRRRFRIDVVGRDANQPLKPDRQGRFASGSPLRLAILPRLQRRPTS